jgi:hypothetical protein
VVAIIWRIASVLILAACAQPSTRRRMAVRPTRATLRHLAKPLHIQRDRSKRPALTAVAGSVATTRRNDRSAGREVQRNSAPT